MENEEKALDQEYIEAGIYEPEEGSTDKYDPETQSVPEDTSEDPYGEPDKQSEEDKEDAQDDPEDKFEDPDGSGDKLEITDDATYRVPNDDGGYDELTGKDIQGRMLLKSKYDQRLQEFDTNVVKPNQQAIDFVDQLDEGFGADPVGTATKLMSNLVQQYDVDYGTMLHELLNNAHRAGELANVTLYDDDTGEYYAPEEPPEISEDPQFQQQIQSADMRAFQAEMRADRSEALHNPGIRKAGVELSEEVLQRADQIYFMYRQNPAFSPTPEARNQYHAAAMMAYNEQVTLGKVQPRHASPDKPELINKNKSPKKRVGPTVPDGGNDPDDKAYRKWGIY